MIDIKQHIENVITHLKESDLYKESDEIIINELYFNLNILEKCKSEIDNSELLVNITRRKEKQPYFHINRYLQLYQQHFQNIMQIIQVLVASPRERSKLKMELKKHEKDALEMMQEKYN